MLNKILGSVFSNRNQEQSRSIQSLEAAAENGDLKVLEEKEQEVLKGGLSQKASLPINDSRGRNNNLWYQGFGGDRLTS